MIELTLLMKLVLIKQAHQKSAIFVIIAFFLDKWFNFQPHFCNGYHDLLTFAIKSPRQS